jgi:hypothetical protein
MPDPGCVFCKIVVGELLARFLYADDTVVSFLDIAPATPGQKSQNRGGGSSAMCEECRFRLAADGS